MKAEELMIGDLVQFACFDKSTITVKVTAIGNNIDGDSDTGSHWCNIWNVLPIPLTDEILEANFEKKGANFGIFDDYFDFELHEYNDGTWLATYHCCEMSLPDEQVMLFHVHQLQHFMRHCGIEKEIIIKKED